MLDPDSETVAEINLTDVSKITQRIAIAHDYLTQRGGAERVAIELARAFPEAPLYTSLYSRLDTYPEFEGLKIRTTALDHIPLFRRHHRLAFPFLAPIFSKQTIDTDLVICSSSGWAHGVQCTGKKLVYCYSPARWLYQGDRYLGQVADRTEVSEANIYGSLKRSRKIRSIAARSTLKLLRSPLLKWDQAAASQADMYVTTSTFVQKAIENIYGIEARVVAPPPALVEGGPETPIDGISSGFFLCVSRLLPYKNVDVVVEAARELPDQQFVIVGHGPMWSYFQSNIGSNIRMLGVVDDNQLRWLYRNCHALLAASHEDFGLTPLEACSFGRPSVVLRDGGFLDTVKEDVTGLFFDRPSPSELVSSIKDCLAIAWDQDELRRHSLNYSPQRFRMRIQELAKEVMSQE